MTTDMIETAVGLNGISFTYPGQEDDERGPLYNNFNLSIHRGSVTAIMGASGSGKSTLGKLLGGELSADRGTVNWTSDLAAELDHFYIDQDPKKVFYPRQTVRENVAYPPKKRKREMGDTAGWVDKLLADFKLASVADQFPLFTSGGQQSRLALARVLSWKPKCIILDEYLSSLDVNTRELVIANLHELVAVHRVTIILITHNLTEALKLADRCLILGTNPVGILADIAIDLPHPRNQLTPGFQSAENSLIDALRDGLL